MNILKHANRNRGAYLIGGPIFFQSFRAAFKLGLFELLAKRPGLTRQDIASALNVQEHPLRILLFTCVAIRLLKKTGDRYRCTLLSRTVCDRDGPYYAGPLLEWGHHAFYRATTHLFEAITQNRPAGLDIFKGDEDNLYGRLAHDPEMEQTFHAFMEAQTKALSRFLLDTFNFGKFRKILDVGGGNGELLIRIAERYHHVSGTLLDFPTVSKSAMDRFQDLGFATRLGAIGGDILADDFPGGHDCIIFCHFLPIFQEETNRRLINKAYVALEPGGVLCVLGAFMDDDECGPLGSALASTYFLCTVNGKGRHYSWKETSSWLREAGFVGIKKKRIVGAQGLIQGFRPHER